MLLEEPPHRAAHARTPVADRIVHEDRRAIAHRSRREAQVAEDDILEMQAVDEDRVERSVRADHIGTDGGNDGVDAREGGLARESARVQMKPRADAQPIGGERGDILRALGEVGVAMTAVHRVELDLEREVRIDRVHFRARIGEQHEQRTRADEGADLEDARSRRGSKLAREMRSEIGRVRRGDRPLRHDLAWIAERLERREHLLEKTGVA